MKNRLFFIAAGLVIIIAVTLMPVRPQVKNMSTTATGKPATSLASLGHPDNPGVQPSTIRGRQLETRSPDPATATGTQDTVSRNYEELWSDLDPLELGIVSAFSARYSGALKFYSADQLSWMQRNGYPMPKDIVLAADMGDEELGALAMRGDAGANALLVDRLITQAAKHGRDLLDRGIDPWTDQDFFLLTRDLMHAMNALYQSGTPFAGYADARAQMEVWGVKTPGPEYPAIVTMALRGLAYAVKQGDHLARNRALWLADEGGVDPEVFNNFLSYHGYLTGRLSAVCDPANRTPDPMPFGVNP